MIVYYVVIVLIVVLGYAAQTNSYSTEGSVLQNNYKNNRFFVMCVFAVLVFVSAFRYNVGADFGNYYNYSKISSWLDDWKTVPWDEIGNKLIALFNVTFLPEKSGVYVIIASFITIFLIVNTLGKNSENLTLSLLLFVFIGAYTGSFNGVRQYFAAAILFAGYRFVVERKLIKWIIIVILASCFHVTAILMVFIYFITMQKKIGYLFVLYACVALVMYFSYDRIFGSSGNFGGKTL